jgi:hypothetical protein
MRNRELNFSSQKVFVCVSGNYTQQAHQASKDKNKLFMSFNFVNAVNICYSNVT